MSQDHKQFTDFRKTWKRLKSELLPHDDYGNSRFDAQSNPDHLDEVVWAHYVAAPCCWLTQLFAQRQNHPSKSALEGRAKGALSWFQQMVFVPKKREKLPNRPWKKLSHGWNLAQNQELTTVQGWPNQAQISFHGKSFNLGEQLSMLRKNISYQRTSNLNNIPEVKRASGCCLVLSTTTSSSLVPHHPSSKLGRHVNSWEYQRPPPSLSSSSSVLIFWKSGSAPFACDLKSFDIELETSDSWRSWMISKRNITHSTAIVLRVSLLIALIFELYHFGPTGWIHINVLQVD